MQGAHFSQCGMELGQALLQNKPDDSSRGVHWGSVQLSTMATVFGSAFDGPQPLASFRIKNSLVNVRPDVAAASVLTDCVASPFAIAAIGCSMSW